MTGNTRTIATATPSEILFVFGHEMGHYVLLHIPKEVAIDVTILLVLIYGRDATICALAIGS